MAITFDSFSENVSSGSSGGTATYAHTNSTSSQGIILVAVMLDSVSDTVSSVTYAGDTLTVLYSDLVAATRIWVGYLLAPDGGSNNVEVTFSGTPSVYRSCAITFSNVNQSDPFGGEASEKNENSNITPLSVDVTVQGATGTVIDFFFGTRTIGGSADTTQTEKMNNTGNWSGGVNHLAGVSYEAHTGSNVNMEWESLTFDSSGADQIHYAVELLPGLEMSGSAVLLGSD